MSRGLSASMVTASQSARVTAHVLAYLNFGSGAVRVWDGIGTLSWDSQSWEGLGTLGSISTIEEKEGVAATGVVLRLAYTDAGLLATALTEDYQGRAVSVYMAMLDTNLAVIADPIQVFGGVIDNMRLADNGTEGVLEINCESYLRILDRTNDRRRTDLDQKTRFSGDRGMELISALQDTPIYWGGPDPNLSNAAQKRLRKMNK